MHGRGKSDGPVVPAKPPNNATSVVAEVVEERGPAKGNAVSETRPGRRAGVSVSSELDRVRQVARKDKDVRFTALLHHVTVERLEEAYRAIRPGAAPGVDGVTWRDYGQDLEANLRDLHARVHRGAYRAKPSRRMLHPEGRRAAAAARGRLAGGQDRPAGAGRGAERDLRAGLPRFLLRVPAGAFTASCVGRARGRDQAQEGELGARRGHPRLLHEPRSLVAWRSSSSTGSRTGGSCS